MPCTRAASNVRNFSPQIDSCGAGSHVFGPAGNKPWYSFSPAPRLPWLNPYVERVISNIRRDALDHVIVLGERDLRRVLRSYVGYYHHWRTHRSLEMDAPEPQAVQAPDLGQVKKLLEAGGLHHHYERRAA